MTDSSTTEHPSSHAPHVPPPGLIKLALEFRAPWEMGSLFLSWPLLQRAPEGEGHAVIVFPGLSAGAVSAAW